MTNNTERLMLQYRNPRLTRNNFDLLRMLFAGTVCLVHTYELSRFKELEWITTVLSSTVAVKAFFIVSGFLIFMSYDRSSSFSAYAHKRIRRIYPAYFAIVFLCAIGLYTVSSKQFGDYFSAEWIKYVIAKLTFLNFLQPNLPGVFEANNMPAVNGALWTLKVEAMFYLSVPLFVFLFRRFSCLPILVLGYCLSLAYQMLMGVLAQRSAGVYAELARQLPGQLSYFMAGAFCYYYLHFFERQRIYFFVAAALALAANKIGVVQKGAILGNRAKGGRPRERRQ